MAMENNPFEDVFLIENGDFYCYVCLPEGRFRFFLPCHTTTARKSVEIPSRFFLCCTGPIEEPEEATR